MKTLTIERPKVRMIYQKLARQQHEVSDNRNAYQRLSKFLKSIKVDHIIFQDADFNYIDRSAARNQSIRLRNLDINISGLLIDSASQFDKTKLYHTDDISVRLDNYAYRTPDNMYDVSIKEFGFSTRQRFAKVTGLRLIPRHQEMQFARTLKTRTARYALRFNEIVLEDIDFKAFNTDRRLLASKLTISNSNMEIFQNKTMPLIEKERLQSFPQIALGQLNLETRVDSVFIHNARVAYSEYTGLTQLPGRIFFDQIEGKISNLSNDSLVLAKDKVGRVTLTGLVMGRGRLNANLDFDLTSKSGAFDLTGNVGNMDGELVNKMLRPLTLVEIRSGFIEHMQFAFKGNVNGTNGKLALRYNDLKISLLAKKEDSSRLRKMNLASMAANILVLKGENPTPGKVLREANIRYSRPDSVSFISMIWKGMLGGLKETIGLDPITQRKIAVKLRELKTVKVAREERREERLKRKEERKQKDRK